MGALFAALAVLVLVAGLLARRRLRRTRERGGLDDEMVRRIEREGRVDWEPEEPLDLKEIRAEEDAFWEQTWDEPEPM